MLLKAPARDGSVDVLIIGGTGLISTAITRRLLKGGHQVTLFNRGRTEAEETELSGVETIHGDRADHAGFESKLTATDGFDCVIDMVCFTPEEADHAVRAYDGVADQVVFCSTVDVYHRPVDRMPIREDASHEPGVSEYGIRKSVCEGIFFDAHDAERFDVTVIRPWSTYGEGGGVHHTFGSDTYYLDRIRRGLPIVVHGDGTSVWGPCHRDDVARAFVGAVGNEAAYGEAYHVTTEEAMTWNRYHRMVAEAMGAPEPTLVHVPTEVLRRVAPDRTEMLEKHYRYSTVFDNSKAKADLGYEYTVSWKDGARRTIDWLAEHDRIRNAEEQPFDDRLIERWRNGIDALASDLTDDR